MKNSVDAIIETYENALTENRRVFKAKGDIRKTNDAIGAARISAFNELKLSIHTICNDRLLDKLREHSIQVKQTKRQQDIEKAKTIWLDLEPGDIRRTVAYVANQSTDGYRWPTYERFLEIMTLPDSKVWKDHYYHCGYIHHMYIGKWAGWWELSWDVFPDNDNLDLYNIMLVTVALGETEHTHFPSLLAELNLFKSASEAKKNGWAKPLATGDFLFKKKTYILRIID